MNKVITTLTVLFVGIQSTFAWYDYSQKGSVNGSSSSSANNSLQAKAANCATTIASGFLEYNNVRAFIETGGSMWQDRSKTQAAYEVPKNSDQYLMFSGALWMGGKDVNNQLKVAALTFRSGNDFWTGPLSVVPGSGDISQGIKDFGPAEIEPDVCAEYDKFFVITREEVERFAAWWDCSQDPSCDVAADFPGYNIPASILNWPAHGDESRFQDFYLAPFKDADGDGIYDPLAGDYPWYDLNNEVDCRASRQVTLYGDYTMWWVFNDKGNIHTETNGDPIGMEVRAQAFAFATNDEINNMTFFNYELVNRSTQRLQDTYFAVWADPDIGCADNDYIGCDVQRGVGYAFNGSNNDVQGSLSCPFPLGEGPPAIGIDFFEGPYQDNDGIDNPLTTNIPTAIAQNGIPYAGLGIGYSDGVIDNERLGMKRFVYFTGFGAQANMSDPNGYTDYYNYMTGFWKDNEPFVYGGQGHPSTTGATTTHSDYMFPGDSDPFNWATGGVPESPAEWTEVSGGNQPGDRRWVQAAGPFTLEPGALNNITVGIVYGKTSSGDAFNSVEQMLKADDKAQALFDNCFRILNGPDAPDLTYQELENEIILYISNKEGSSNNYDSLPEDYIELDPVITSLGDPSYDPFYRFQGYQIYQIKNTSVGPEELENTELARLVAQCDIEDDISQIINFPLDEDLGYPVATEMVDGENEGIRHSFRITEDAFAQGIDKKLVNHKKYYYMAVAYAHNDYKTYILGGDGQLYPYLRGRKGANGPISYITVIPHSPSPETGGTVSLAPYGYGPQITRVEGRGNGGTNVLFLTEESEEKIVSDYAPKEVTYDYASGPVGIKVIDPLNVLPGQYTLRFTDWTAPAEANKQDIPDSKWILIRDYEGVQETINSESTIKVGYEQLIPEWGISVDVEQYAYVGTSNNKSTELLYNAITYEDSSRIWMSGVYDADGQNGMNWIRSGSVNVTSTGGTCSDDEAFWNDENGLDDEEVFEKVIGGMWGPFKLVGTGDCEDMPLAANIASYQGSAVDMMHSSSVDIVITSDKSKWTRVPVLELQDNSALSWNGSTAKCRVKLKPSKDKSGKQAGQSGYNSGEGDFNGSQPLGMSWFPGYAIDISSGERLNMAFGEDSWLVSENGDDMLWNPSSNLFSQAGDLVYGGKHYVYIFKNASKYALSNISYGRKMGAYDGGYEIYEALINSPTSVNTEKVWTSCSWIGTPMLSENADLFENEEFADEWFSFISTDVRMSIRTASVYERHCINGSRVNDNSILGQSQNDWYPMYTFDMSDIATQVNNETALDSACQLMNVVPNPYYAYSNYEFNRLENLVKIVNLPDQCNVRIYNTSGTLVRSFSKDSPITHIEWDLKNHVGIPIASGMYLIHIEVPGGCERVIKWLGVVRPPDLENF